MYVFVRKLEGYTMLFPFLPFVLSAFLQSNVRCLRGIITLWLRAQTQGQTTWVCALVSSSVKWR